MLELFRMAGDLYFNPKKIEGDGKIYEIIGIRAFRRFVLKIKNGHLMLLRHRREEGESNYFISEHSINGIKKFDRQATRHNEAIHIFALLPSTFGVLYYPRNTFAWFMVAFNLYCIFLQRYNRCRIHNILKVQKELWLPDSAIVIHSDLQYEII